MLVVIDVSSVMHTGIVSRQVRFGADADFFNLRCIPYFLEKIAAYYIEGKEMVAVFEKIHKIPSLARTDGYKSGRSRNPLVEWEIRALKALLEEINFPVVEVDGQESDHVINNIVRENKHLTDIAILTADMDLASNVSQGDYTSVCLRSFSTKSYNVDKHNFELITGVPYNFINLNKLLLGCESDKIKPYPQGDEIFNDYINSVLSLWKRKYTEFNPKEHKTSLLIDSLIENVNNLDAFLSWFKYSSYSPTEQNIEELKKRYDLVAGKVFPAPNFGTPDWVKYNSLANIFNRYTVYGVKAEERPEYDPNLLQRVLAILSEAKDSSATLFEGSDMIVQEEESVSDINNILGILAKEDDL